MCTMPTRYPVLNLRLPPSSSITILKKTMVDCSSPQGNKSTYQGVWHNSLRNEHSASPKYISHQSAPFHLCRFNVPHTGHPFLSRVSKDNNMPGFQQTSTCPSCSRRRHARVFADIDMPESQQTSTCQSLSRQQPARVSADINMPESQQTTACSVSAHINMPKSQQTSTCQSLNTHQQATLSADNNLPEPQQTSTCQSLGRH